MIIMYAFYRNSGKLQTFEESVDWNEEFDRFKISTKPLQKVLEALFCANHGKLGTSKITKQIIQNIYSASSDENLDHNIKVFLNVLPTALRYFIEQKLNIWHVDAEKWLNPFFMTNLIKENKGLLGKILTHEIEEIDVAKTLGETIDGLVFLSSNTLYDEGIF